MLDPRTIPLLLPASERYLTHQGVLAWVEDHTVERRSDVLLFLASAFGECRDRGVNPDVLVGMSHLETGGWTSMRWRDHGNPGGIGATDDGAIGHSFPDGLIAARAMAVHLVAYARGRDDRIADWIPLDPRYSAVEAAGFADSVRTLAGLGNGKWATDPRYDRKVASRIEQLARFS